MRRCSGFNSVKFLARVLVALVFLVAAAGTSAQERMRVGWAAMTASHTPLWVAQEKGFFGKHGLSGDPVCWGAGRAAMRSLVAGDLDVVITSAPSDVGPRLGGSGVVMGLS